jgi:hypothetical protein
MVRRAHWGVLVALLLGFCASARAQVGYLDSFVVQVRPEKRLAFDALAKKIALANRDHNGDNWIALETIYGEGNTISFISTRSSYGDIEKATGAFMAAMEKGLGKEGSQKLFAELNNCAASQHGTVRIRRYDLSTNFPADAAGQATILGATRWIRIIKVYVRPGMGPRFEELIKQVNEAASRNGDKNPTAVSQIVAGERGTIYYVSQLFPSLGGLDGMKPLPQMMGESAFEKFEKGVSEVVTSTDVSINQILPDLSNPPAAYVEVAPDFWRPKPAKSMAPKPTGDNAMPGKTPAKSPAKKNS